MCASTASSRVARGASRISPIRANQLIETADRGVFIWDGKNMGIAELIEKAEDKGTPVEVVRFGPAV